MASIQIANARKSYGAVDVLHGIDLDISDGEFIVLVGPSGCGKSTLLRMIAGLEDITSGDISIAGNVVNELQPKDRDIAMVFQSYALYPHMSVAENMSYALTLRKTAREKIADAISGVAEILGLTALLERRPKALSGGQRQRVAMGRAIVRKPQAFLFDEPLSNLDARLREQMRTEIRKLHRRLGATSVYVTHDQIEAMTMADRIVAMHDGIIQQVGSPVEIYDRPANIFVASFIGSPAMNFLEGSYEQVGENSAGIRLTDGALVPVLPARDAQNNLAVTLGARPEHITIVSDGENGLPAKVELIEPMGLSTLVHVTLAGKPIKIFTMDRPAYAVDSFIHIAFDMAKVHVFDSASEKRLPPASEPHGDHAGQ
ncbi:sn-glycerol-3-phosphate ABC transporter ATP-binding protein UgpC [Thalassospira sp. GO-4]|jgi:multiple sugar transport system ATP-binding protein|uniref:ABC transporter ATP-binding protein n=1 Tax=Thalassospira sp. GO-4 TaxID=2946605 RepID=UPI0020246F46|nr:sn-glycerol-3-phosphate ABC transporter ATP-binding protein UgpC [Thalassospira sp. GO-4]URK19395.1 sn-glycerol-3-phosphate ABC transporter ATP-binding protein UgpC [Thalassospira sp. GO-4]